MRNSWSSLFRCERNEPELSERYAALHCFSVSHSLSYCNSAHVITQDQGFTGFDGVGACFKGADYAGLGFGAELSCGLRLNVTIVAVNDPPQITVKIYCTECVVRFGSCGSG